MKTSVVLLPLPPLPPRPLGPPSAQPSLALSPLPLAPPPGPPIAAIALPPLPVPPINQATLMARINNFLGHFVDDKSEKESLPKVSGMCHGFAIMMMRADMIGERKKHLQRLHAIVEKRSDQLKKSADLLISYKEHFRKVSESEKKAILAKNPETKSFNLDYNLVRQRAIDEMKMNQEQKQMLDFGEDLYLFANSLSTAHYAREALELKVKDHDSPRTIIQSDILEILALIAPDQFLSKDSVDQKKSEQKKQQVEIPYQVGYQFHFPLRVVEMIVLFETTVFNGNLVAIGSANHRAYVTKNNNKYVLYDSNFTKEPLEFDSATELFTNENGIKHYLYKNVGVKGDLLPFALQVLEQKNARAVPRPTPSQFINRFFAQRQQEAKESKSKAHGIEAKTDDGNNALHFAIANCDFPCVSELIVQGADPNALGDNHWRPLIRAAEFGSLPIVTLLLAAPGILIDEARGDDKYTALHLACAYNHPEVAYILILNGADMTKENTSNQTPLEVAASLGYEECVKVLLENGAEFMSLLSFYPDVFFKALLKIENIESLHADSVQHFITNWQELTRLLETYVEKLFEEKKQEVSESVRNAQNALGKIFNPPEAKPVLAF